jgi:hypothetical protein
MYVCQIGPRTVLPWAVILLCLSVAPRATAQETGAPKALRAQYDALMADFERVAKLRGDTATSMKARRGREAMNAIPDAQLAELYRGIQKPDLSAAVMASRVMVERTSTQAEAKTGGLVQTMSAGWPEPVPEPGGCAGVDISAETRYVQLIAKETTTAILAAAAFVCTESFLGTNGAAACIPLAIAADIATGFFDTSTFCAAEVTVNQVDANFRRLDHLHDDLWNGVTAIVDNQTANTASIIADANANTETINVNNDTNTTTIVVNDNTNTAAILTNATANQNELRDLILRSQIEADLAMVDASAVVAIYALPKAQGGYLDLVQAIVAQSIARVAATGAGVGNAPAILRDADAAKAGGDFLSAYAMFRRAYKAAGK